MSGVRVKSDLEAQRFKALCLFDYEDRVGVAGTQRCVDASKQPYGLPPIAAVVGGICVD